MVKGTEYAECENCGKKYRVKFGYSVFCERCREEIKRRNYKIRMDKRNYVRREDDGMV
jgi:hypothetical protein